MDDLAKRTAGAPLTEAEHAQRVAAARARWTAGALGAGAAAAAAAGVASAIRIKRQRIEDTARVREALAPVIAARTANLRRNDRVGTAVTSIDKGLTPSGGDRFLRHAVKTMRSQLRRADLVARQEEGIAAPYLHADNTDFDFDPMVNARSEAKFLADRLEDVQTNGKGSRRVDVAAAKPHKVRGYTATRKGKPEALWDPFADAKLAHLMSELGLPKPAPAKSGSVDKTGSLLALDKYIERVGRWQAGHASGSLSNEALDEHVAPSVVRETLTHVRSLEDVEALVQGMTKVDRSAWLAAYHLPDFKIVRPEKPVRVPEVKDRMRGDGRMTVAGYPDRATRKRLSQELRPDVQARALAWHEGEAPKAAARVAQARTAARPVAFKAARRLAFLTPGRRPGVIAGAAALAALGGYAAVRGVQNALGKHAGQPRDALGRFAGEASRGHTAEKLGTNPYRTDFARHGEPPRVTMLVGMPGSGKSTWRAMRLAQAAIRPTTVISTDEKIEDIGRQWGLPFSEAFKRLDHKQVDREHRAALRVALRAGHDVIIDRVNASPTGRAKWLRRVPAHYESHAVVFHVPEHELRARRARRAGKVIPGRALGEMRDAYKAPTAEEFDFVHHVRPEQAPLSKSAPDPTHPQAAGDAAEAEMAQRLAAMFGRWTDGAEAALDSDTPGVLTSGMSADLDEAFKPLDAALRAGAGVPVLSGEGGKTIAFSFLARDPKVEAFIARYRSDKIAELADEQRLAIRDQLLDAARTGASPDAMARRIRETIGLTSTQMSHVQNYRVELEELKAGALTRELRDRRFDKPIIRALATGTPIAPDKIDQYVDAYHRRYLAFRAMTIARTEGVGAANNGQAAAAAILVASQPGMDVEKTWMTRIDGHERDDHHELNGKTVLGLDTPFRCESGDLVRWPHDPRAPARQVVRCRCAWVTRLVSRPESSDSQANRKSTP